MSDQRKQRIADESNVDWKAKYEAAKAVLGYREAELLEIKGPCRTAGCRLHYAHSGPCVIAGS